MKSYSILCIKLLLVLCFLTSINAQVPDAVAGEYGAMLELVGNKDYDRAASICEQLILSNPEFPKPYEKLVQISKRRNAFQHTKSFLDSLVLEAAYSANAFWAIGMLHEQKDDYEITHQAYRASLTHDPEAVYVYPKLINLYVKQPGRTADSLLTNLIASLLEDSLSAAKQFAIGYYYHSVYEDKSDLKSSYEFVARALKQDSMLIEAYYLGGITHFFLGNYRECEKFWSKGEEISKNLNDFEMTAKFSGRLGAIYGRMGNYDKALQNFKNSFEVVKRIGAREEQLNQLGNIATIYRYLSKYYEALAYFDTTLSLARDLSNKRSEGMSLVSIANIYSDLGDHAKALDYYQQGYDICIESGEKRTATIALIGLGTKYSQLNLTHQALRYLRQGLELARKLGDRRSEGSALHSIGSVYLELKEFEKAKDHLHQALDIANKLRTGRSIVANLINLAVLEKETENIPEAREFISEGFQLAQKLNDHRLAAYAQIILGDLMNLDRKNNPELSEYQQVLRIAQEIGDPALEINSRYKLALNLRKRSQIGPAITHFEQAISLLERSRESLRYSGYKVGFLTSHVRLYEQIIDVLFALYQQDRDEQHLRKAFHYAERSKARTLVELLARNNLGIADDVDSGLIEKEQYLSKKLAYVNRAISIENSRNPIDAMVLDSLKDNRSQIYSRLDELVLRYRQTNSAFANLKFPVSYTVEDVQNHIINKGQMLIEYFVGERVTYEWRISKTDFTMRTIDLDREGLIEEVVQISPLFSPNASDSVAEDFRQLKDADWANISLGKLHKVYAKLWSESKMRLDSTIAELIIVPDGILSYLPFEMLVTEIQNGRPRFLVEDYAISYLSSATLLDPRLSRTPKKTEYDIVAIGNPDFNVVGDPEKPSRLTDFINNLFRDQGWKLLPESENEVNEIAKYFKKPLVLTGTQASEENLRANAGHCRYLHIASHYLVDDQLPLFSKLILAQNQKSERNDGYLHSYEVFNLGLNADLVTLSGCNTGLGQFSRGEGFLGLSRAFRYAGAANLVVSLWAVEDRSTAEFMSKFYYYLGQNIPYKLALQRAKIDFINSATETSDPFHWAPFVLIGQ